MEKRKFLSVFSIMVVLLALTVVGTTSCGNRVKRAEVEKNVKMLNKRCPITMDGVGQLTRVTVEDDDVVFSYLFTYPLELSVLKQNSQLLMENILACMSFDKNGQQIVSDIAEAGMGMKVVYTVSGDNDSFSVRANNDELKKAISEPMTPRKALDLQIKIAKLQLPQQIDEVTTQTDTYIEGNYFYYVYTINEQYGEINPSQEDLDQIKEEIKQRLHHPAMKSVLNLIVKNDLGLCMRYIGERPRKEINIEFAVDELRVIR